MTPSIDDIVGRQREAANALAVLAAAEAEYHGAELALQRSAQRLTQARAAAEKANGRVHLARLWAMLARG